MDRTKARRQQRRREALFKIAIEAGWMSWTHFETAAKNGVVQIPHPPRRTPNPKPKP